MTDTLTVTPRISLEADPTTRFRRVASAIALPLAFALQLVCNATYAIVSSSGLTDTGDGAETLQFYATYADEARLMSVFALAGSLVAIPGLLAGLRVLRPRAPRLSLVAVILMISGYVCYFGVVCTNFDTVALATLHPGAGDVIDASQAMPETLPIFGLFVLGNLVGTLLLGLAVILGRDLPWIAGVLIIGWPVGHVLNLVGGGEWFAVAGGALEIIGLSILMMRALRTSDAQWAARG